MKAKKICVLAYLSMAITVGAVYATWTYATGNVDPVSIEGINIGITAAVTTTKGTLATYTETINMTIENDGSCNPIIEWTDSDGNATGNTATIIVGFKPNAGYSGTSISLKASVSFIGNTWTYGGTTYNIFNSSAQLPFEIDWSGGASDNSTLITSGEYTGFYATTLDVYSLFTLNTSTPALTTYEMYEAYKTGLDATTATITISDNS